MVEEQQQATEEQDLTDEQAILKIADAMRDSVPGEERSNVHTFLLNVVQAEEAEKIIKVGNLRDDKEMNELGKPTWTARGDLRMILISKEIMENKYYADYFKQDVVNTVASSLSREGFLIKQATVTTKQVADVTRRRKINKGMFGSKVIEESGGDTSAPQTGGPGK